MPSLVRPPWEGTGELYYGFTASVKQEGICRAVYRASQSLGGLGPLSSCAQRQFCKRATPFHDPGPRKFLQFHATRLWCGAEPDTSPPGAGMRYSPVRRLLVISASRTSNCSATFF